MSERDELRIDPNASQLQNTKKYKKKIRNQLINQHEN
jgi:hypothetical protein